MSAAAGLDTAAAETARVDAASAAYERHLPPVAQLAVCSMACIVAGGVYMASHIPKPAPLAPATGLLGVAVALLAIDVVALARVPELAWRTFFRVGGWALLAYVTITGMLEYVFLFDHLRGGQLAVLSGMLAVFALDIPLLLAFSVARYQPAGD